MPSSEVNQIGMLAPIVDYQSATGQILDGGLQKVFDIEQGLDSKNFASAPRGSYGLIGRNRILTLRVFIRAFIRPCGEEIGGR
jgi:hypothetical protein